MSNGAGGLSKTFLTLELVSLSNSLGKYGTYTVVQLAYNQANKMYPFQARSPALLVSADKMVKERKKTKVNPIPPSSSRLTWSLGPKLLKLKISLRILNFHEHFLNTAQAQNVGTSWALANWRPKNALTDFKRRLGVANIFIKRIATTRIRI